MPDIAMCSGEGCAVRGECYRHTAKPGEWQVWFHTPPREDGACMWIIPIKGDGDRGKGNHITTA